MEKFIACMTMIFVLMFAGGCASTNGKKVDNSFKAVSAPQEQGATQPSQANNEIKNIPIKLYFSNKNDGKLVSEKRLVTKKEIMESPEKTIINELIKGPENQELLPTIPKGTKLISVTNKEGTAIVNFSREFVDNHGGGSMGETITIFSIVNSLTELKEIQKVKFLIEGESRPEYKGHYEFDIPFVRDEEVNNNI